MPEINENEIMNNFKLIFNENFTKLNNSQKSSDQIVSDLIKNNLRKIMKNSFQKKPEIEVHLIRY